MVVAWRHQAITWINVDLEIIGIHPSAISQEVHKICCQTSPFKSKSFTHLPLMPHVRVSELAQNWFRWWLVACSATSHYLNQCWLFCQLDPYEQASVKFESKYTTFLSWKWIWNVVWEMAAILPRGGWVWVDELKIFMHLPWNTKWTMSHVSFSRKSPVQPMQWRVTCIMLSNQCIAHFTHSPPTNALDAHT